MLIPWTPVLCGVLELQNREPNFLIDKNYMIPTEPAVKPTARKKTNSNKSLGK